MLIQVVEWSNNNIYYRKSEASFFLEQDSWNDYNYYTMYHLHVSGKHTKDKEHAYIGTVKILKKNQEKDEMYLVKRGKIDGLSDSFCSLGQSLDYYERIAQLDKQLRDQILFALRDIVIHPEFGKNFEHDEGWNSSFFRYIRQDDDIFSIAPILITRDFQKLPSLDLKFEFIIPGMSNPVKFDFDSPKYGWEKTSLPNRLAVIIGRNGSGKSTFISKLSRLAFTSTKDRTDEVISKVGAIYPIGLGFPRIVNLSYSAFDSFQVPGIYKHEKEQIAKDIKAGVGRYIFCGIRDISKELHDILQDIKTHPNGKLLDEYILGDKQESTILKSIATLVKEFTDLILLIRDSPKKDILNHAVNILLEDPSITVPSELLESLSDEEISNFFKDLSTGHKFVLHSLASIVFYTEKLTLLLFDEPETHLHPPILAVLMRAIRYILEKQNAFMIVATHSPIIAQETLKKHVFIIRRLGAQIEIDPPEIQTFGENIGLITSTVFGLTSDITDYHTELDKIIRSHTDFDFDPEAALSSIENLFEGELSMQARAYIMSKLFEKHN